MLCILMVAATILSCIASVQPHMHLRFIFLFTIGAVLVPPVVFAQEQNAPTLDELVAKNIEAKGGADALGALQSVKVTGKLLVNEGQLQLGYTETKKRPGEVRSERSEERRVGKECRCGGRRCDS